MRKLSLICISIALALAVSFFPQAASADHRAVRDVQYYNGPDADWEYHILDVFVPEGSGPWPVLIFIHGGAWTICDKDDFPHSNLGRAFAERGILCVSINYRLSPEVQFPEHARDTARAVAWTYANIEEYGGDPDHVVISGHSAGAHLATIVALNPEFLKEQGLDTTVLRGAVGLSGPYDVDLIMDISHVLRPWGRFKLRQVFGDDPEVWEQAAPINFVEPPHVPVMIMVGSEDLLTPEAVSRRFYNALEGARDEQMTKTELVIAPGKGHVGLLLTLAKEDDRYADRMEQFIRRQKPEPKK